MARSLLNLLESGDVSRRREEHSMTTLHALRHVSSAVHHAEALADEAEDLGNLALAARLRERAAAVAADLEAAVQAIDDVTPARDQRARAHLSLNSVYGEVTLRLEQIFAPEVASRLSPGGHLDVAERARFRQRHLPPRPASPHAGAEEALEDLRALLERALFSYDAAVDDYLLACADAQSKKDRVIVKSQALRVELERAKQGLLIQAPVDSDVYKRIRRRTVRTKRARWLDEAKAQRLLADAFA
jgi:hypothetical protein